MHAAARWSLRRPLSPLRPLELAGLRLLPGSEDDRLCTQITRELRERRVVGLKPFVRPPSKESLRFRLPHFEQRKAWASRHALLPRMGGVAAHVRFYKRALETPHPLCAKGSSLPDDLLAAVAYVVGKGESAPQDRASRVGWLQSCADRLAPLNARLIAMMPPHVRAAAGGMNLALVSCMIDALPGYPDRFLVRRFVHGFSVVGDIEDSGLFRLIPEEDRAKSTSPSQVFEEGSNLVWIAGLESKMSFAGNKPGEPPSDSARAAYEATLKECVGPDVTTWGVELSPEEAARTGRSHRGLSQKEVDDHPWLQEAARGPHGARGRWRPMRRFAIWQNGKWRPCDHARESLHNECTRPSESLAGQATAERPVELTRAFADAHGRPVAMHGGTDDWPRAYRRAPVSHPRFTVVAVWNPFDRRVEYFLLAGFNFGLVSAVCAYNRWPRLVISAARAWLGCCADSYFDDAFVGEPQYARGSGQWALGALAALLGTPFSADKHAPPSESPTFLGVVTDLSRVVSHGEICCSVTEARRSSVSALAQLVLDDDRISGACAAKLTGKARWMLCPCFGRVGIAVLQPLYKVRGGGESPLSKELRESVSAVRLLADEMPPRRLPVRAYSGPPTVIFTDAAFEGGKGTIGVVVKRPGFPLVWTACDCPGWVLAAFQEVDRRKEQYIGQLELLAAVVAYTTFPDLLAGQHVIHWIDNESAVYSLAKGYSGAADSARVVNLFHACVAQLGVTPWLEYVGTDDNIADLPSRGEWRLLLTLGGSGSFRAAVVPPVSSFVGPLLPLLGRRVAPV